MTELAPLPRVPTHVSGLDTVLGGGLLAGDAYLVVGEPGTGKTTLGNQLAFAHVAAGGTAVVASLQTEAHDRILAHLSGLRFVDSTIIGDQLSYISLLGPWQDGGLDGVLEAVTTTIRQHKPSLLVIDGAGATESQGASRFDHGQFIHRLQTHAALYNCTTVLLAGTAEAGSTFTHVDGVLELSNQPVASRDVRWLRVAKLRGSRYLTGFHEFTIGEDGIAVFPRFEATRTDLVPAWHDPAECLGVGVAALDAMLHGGLAPASSTLLLGTPGAGKTILGLQFLAEGAKRGEPGLIASFQETAPALVSTASRAGIAFAEHLESGVVEVLWRSPLELSPDRWVWDLLAAIDRHQPRRLVVDAYTDLIRLFAVPERQTRFANALTNELRHRGVTAMFILEVDVFAGPEVSPPVPNVSATMDTGIFLRMIELRSELRRLISILKHRQSGFDATIREFVIGNTGIEVNGPFAAQALLTGTAVPTSDQAAEAVTSQ